MLSQQHWTNDHPKKDFLWIKSGDSALEHCCWCRRRGKNRIENPETVGAGPIMNSRRHFQKHELEAAGQAHLSLVICHMSLSALVSLGEKISITRLPSQNISISWLLNPTFDGKNPTFDPSRLWIRSSTTPEEGHAGINEETKHPIRLLYCTYFDGMSCVISNPESVVC